MVVVPMDWFCIVQQAKFPVLGRISCLIEPIGKMNMVANPVLKNMESFQEEFIDVWVEILPSSKDSCQLQRFGFQDNTKSLWLANHREIGMANKSQFLSSFLVYFVSQNYELKWIQPSIVKQLIVQKLKLKQHQYWSWWVIIQSIA